MIKEPTQIAIDYISLNSKEKLAVKLNISRPTLDTRLKSRAWNPKEIKILIDIDSKKN